MTYKQIEASREARLWIGQVIVPAVIGAGAIVASHPELVEKAKTKYGELKNKLTKKESE